MPTIHTHPHTRTSTHTLVRTYPCTLEEEDWSDEDGEEEPAAPREAMLCTFVNNTEDKLQVKWDDGGDGVVMDDLDPWGEYACDTFTTDEFYFYNEESEWSSEKVVMTAGTDKVIFVWHRPQKFQKMHCATWYFRPQ